jgi:hypothetical protein
VQSSDQIPLIEYDNNSNKRLSMKRLSIEPCQGFAKLLKTGLPSRIVICYIPATERNLRTTPPPEFAAVSGGESHMSRRGFAVFFILAVSCASVSSVVSSVFADESALPKYRLAYKFTAGEALQYSNSTEMQFDFQQESGDLTQTSRSEFLRTFHVLETASTGTRIQVVLDRVRMSHGSSNTELRVLFSSDDPSTHNEKFSHVLDALGKPTSQATVSPSGKFSQFKALLDSRGKPRTEGAISTPGESGVDQGWLPMLPEQEVAIGDRWEQRFEQKVTEQAEVRFSTPMPMLRVYKLAKVAGKEATVDFSVVALKQRNEVEIQKQLILAEPKGYFVFDLESGRVLLRQWKSEKTILGWDGPKTSLRGMATQVERLMGGPYENPPAEAAAEKATRSR